jgi:DNA repair ATPase RecN
MMKNLHPSFFMLPLAVLLVLSSGCETLQTLGNEHRENLTFHVEKAEEEQQEAKEQFQSAFDEFTALVNFDGGELEAKYRQLQSEYDLCETRAEHVRSRIQKIETVSVKLFDEWGKELQQYHSDTLRESSQKMMSTTKIRYNTFVVSMKRAESKMKPVLDIFADQVLFLKHNLNANAISSLKSSVVDLESDVESLVKELEKSINDAQMFIKSMQQSSNR